MAAARRARGAGGGTFQDLVRLDLRTKRYRPVYLLVGEDSYRIEKVVAHLREEMLGPGGAAFNFHLFQGDQAGLDAVLQQALSFPMLGGRQLIWLREADRCVGEPATEKALLRYLADPPEATVLVMSAAKVDGRRRWARACREAGFLFDFSPPSGRDLLQWVRKTAQKAGVPLNGELADMLVELVGDDLHALAAEIEKLALLAEESGGRLDEAQLEELIAQQRLGDVFELSNALRPGDAVPGLRVWRRQTAWGRGPHDLAPLLMSRLRKMALVASLAEEGIDPREIPSLLGMHPYACRQLLAAARQLGPAGLQRALVSCATCDARLKGSSLPAEIVMERTILDLCGAPP
jgi:DNA polymerase-3 subunit delta